jgi:hypothetical protein
MPTRSGLDFSVSECVCALRRGLHCAIHDTVVGRASPAPPTTSAFLNSLPGRIDAARSLFVMTVGQLGHSPMSSTSTMPSSVLFPERHRPPASHAGEDTDHKAQLSVPSSPAHSPHSPRSAHAPPIQVSDDWLNDLLYCYEQRDVYTLSLAVPIPVYCPELAHRCNCGMWCSRTFMREPARFSHLPACTLAEGVVNKVNARLQLSFSWVRASWRCAIDPMVMAPRHCPTVPSSPGVTTPRPSTTAYCVCDHCWQIAGGPGGYPAATLAAMIMYAREQLGSRYILWQAMDQRTQYHARAVVCRVIQEARQRMAIGNQPRGAVMIDGNSVHRCSFCPAAGNDVRSYAVNACQPCADYHEVGGMGTMPVPMRQ